MNMRRENDLRQKLFEEIRQAAANKERCIPSEVSLAEKLKVSRTQIRDCMGELESEGYVSRGRGLGTRINQHVLDVPLRMDFEIEFDERVRAMGYEPETIVSDVSIVMCDKEMAKKLNVGTGTPVLRVAKTVSASGTVAIYCIDHISYKVVINYEYTNDAFEAPIYEFLRTYCGTDVSLNLTKVNAVVADKTLSGILNIAEGSPLLNLDELGYDIDGNPIMWSLEYFVPDLISYTVLRKRR